MSKKLTYADLTLTRRGQDANTSPPYRGGVARSDGVVCLPYEGRCPKDGGVKNYI